jgi:hypothetical protein
MLEAILPALASVLPAPPPAPGGEAAVTKWALPIAGSTRVLSSSTGRSSWRPCLGSGHSTVAWLLSLARLARSKALIFDRQVSADPQLPLAVLARVHLTFHAFFESVQTALTSRALGPNPRAAGAPTSLPQAAAVHAEVRPGSRSAWLPAGARNSAAAVNSASVAPLQIGAGRNLGNCIRTAAAAGKAIPLIDDGRRNFCLTYHYVGSCNQSCGGSPMHRVLSRGEEQRLHAWKVH